MKFKIPPVFEGNPQPSRLPVFASELDAMMPSSKHRIVSKPCEK